MSELLLKTKRIAEGDYEAGPFRIYRLCDVFPPAWNVETGSALIVDGAATKADALALLADFVSEALAIAALNAQA